MGKRSESDIFRAGEFQLRITDVLRLPRENGLNALHGLRGAILSANYAIDHDDLDENTRMMLLQRIENAEAAKKKLEDLVPNLDELEAEYQEQMRPLRIEMRK